MRMRVCGKRRREKEGRGVLWGLMVMVTVITIYYQLREFTECSQWIITVLYCQT